MKIQGSRNLGLNMHQWHSGMDPVYGVGSLFFAGHPAEDEYVENALSILKQTRSRGSFSRKDGRHLNAVIRELERLLKPARGKEPRENPAKLPRRVEGLVRMGVPLDKAKYLHAEMGKVERSPFGGSASHRAVDAILDSIDASVRGHGVESIEGDWVDRYYQNIVLLYVNMGDTYTTTLAFDTNTTRFYVTSWGDWVERNGDKRGVQ